MASAFDPASFLHQSVEGANDTTFTPVPEGEYLALADKVEVNRWQKSDGSAAGLRLDVTWEIQDDAVKQLLGRDKITVRQGQMLDLTESGQLDMGKGKNIGLGRIRAATDLNDPSQPIQMSMIQGRLAKISVKHRVHEDQIYAEVKSIAHA